MALKLTISFPVFAPSPSSNSCFNANPKTSGNRPLTEVRFSRWNNGPWKKFNEQRRTQQEIEDDIRRHRRFDSATKIAQIQDSDPTISTATTTTITNDVYFKSRGTPSSPSSASIPGKKSKYSKPPDSDIHPAFRRIWKRSKITNMPKENPINPDAKLNITEDGVSYVIDGAPFEFKYSYTETPKVKPLKLREPPFAPFGPTTMARPWTGRAPLPPSKKQLKEFDSFELPPPNKKGVKPVQKPGPFRPGTGPRYVYTREEILGEPLSKEEVEELVHSCMKSQRQLNMGRDGLTHNMLDNIHAHWKRRRVCKIKCKGVCTVDMDNVCQQLEERTGGKVIQRRGGVLYLFRGRNYNYKTRPRFPLMLWKPVTPVYPRLIQRVPEGLTPEEASEMRMKGRKLIPICKLGKNGVYCDLVKNVREAFEECELVRINCEGMNGSDYRKIGAKLKDLVPCVLISFEREHILMWRGWDWKSSLAKPESDSQEAKESEIMNDVSVAPPLESNVSITRMLSVEDASPEVAIDITQVRSEDVHAEPCEYLSCEDANNNEPHSTVAATNISANETDETTSEESKILMEKEERSADSPEFFVVGSGDDDKSENILEVSHDHNDLVTPYGPDMERVLLLRNQALESGIAMMLDDDNLDADVVYERSVSFAKSAPPGPVFKHRSKKKVVEKTEKKAFQNSESKEFIELEVKKEVATIPHNGGNVRQTYKNHRDLVEDYVDTVPQGSLGVDELAKLLA